MTTEPKIDRKLKSMAKQLEKEMGILSKRRDSLRQMESDIGELIDDCERAEEELRLAVENITDAADILSTKF
jgi:hypothetical protein